MAEAGTPRDALEEHASMQGVGEASAEAPEKMQGEQALSPEQQKAMDAMQKEGQKLERDILDAREKSAVQLKKLQGKELVNAGFKQMGHGLWETVKGEGIGLGFGIIFGAVAGGLMGQVTNLIKPKGGAIIGMASFGAIGVLSGSEIARLHYNKKVTKEHNLPPTRWMDHVLSGTGITGVLALASRDVISNYQKYSKGRGALVGGSTLLAAHILNPITIGGLRNIATGLWQMRRI